MRNKTFRAFAVGVIIGGEIAFCVTVILFHIGVFRP